MTREREQIIAFLVANDGPATTRSIADGLGKRLETVRSLCWKMHGDGLLRAGGYGRLNRDWTLRRRT
jgi:DeoR/GlpR family transcriptional regulator of sugar metabolism